MVPFFFVECRIFIHIHGIVARKLYKRCYTIMGQLEEVMPNKWDLPEHWYSYHYLTCPN